MARTALTAITAISTNPTAGTALVWTAADVANGNSVACTGKELILVQNSGGASYTFTLASAADTLGRTKDITAETLTTLQFKTYGVPQTLGWRQTDGTLWLNGSNAAILFCVIRLP